PSFDHAFGIPLFRYLERTPEAREVFDRAMTIRSSGVARDVAWIYDFSRVRRVVDVGGGQGGILIPLLVANPRLSGILFDLPSAARAALSELAKAGLTDRCQVVGGDFFRAVPRGGDVYVLRNVLLDWDDQRAVRILRNCRRAMTRESVLLIVEI